MFGEEKMKVVEVKACCWVCQFLEWDNVMDYFDCSKGYPVLRLLKHVCDDFELKEELKPPIETKLDKEQLEALEDQWVEDYENNFVNT